MRHKISLRDDFAHRDSRKILAMSDGAFVLFLALKLKHERLSAAAMRVDGALDDCAGDVLAGFDGIAIHQRDHAAELDGCADVAREGFDFNGFARGDTILFSASFDDSVHNGIPY